jgi:hypothetical protein
MLNGKATIDVEEIRAYTIFQVALIPLRLSLSVSHHVLG